VAGVRGLGLLLAVQLAEGIDARTVAADLLAAGVIVNAVTPTALRLAPSLLIDDDDIAEAVAAIGAVLDHQEVAP
jgi:acetylornithine aminotransferase